LPLALAFQNPIKVLVTTRPKDLSGENVAFATVQNLNEMFTFDSEIDKENAQVLVGCDTASKPHDTLSWFPEFACPLPV
jgi:hypothetical protein